MKRILSLLVIITIALTMVSCQENAGKTSCDEHIELISKLEKENEALKSELNKEEKYNNTITGSWTHTVNALDKSIGSANTDPDDTLLETYVFYKGGTGKLCTKNLTKNKTWSDRSFTWEINDEVINIRFSQSWIEAFVYDETSNTVTRMDDNAVLNKVE